VADRQAEQHLRQRIAAAFPADGILGEELGEQPGTSGYRWILDPIDGTKSFIHGVPLYGTLIGCEYQGRSVLGLIRIPRLDECVYATAGQGAWYTAGNEPPRPARVGGCRRLAEATLCTSDIEGFRVVDRWSVFERLQAAASLVRTWGDCYGYLLAATGRIDLMVDPRMHVWDAAALLPILEEAGGAFTDWQGQPTITGGNGIGGNRELVAAAPGTGRPGRTGHRGLHRLPGDDGRPHQDAAPQGARRHPLPARPRGGSRIAKAARHPGVRVGGGESLSL
jgi:histidinol phosphatase-like enzyme (inositol monophosphatase family)